MALSSSLSSRTLPSCPLSIVSFSSSPVSTHHNHHYILGAGETVHVQLIPGQQIRPCSSSENGKTQCQRVENPSQRPIMITTTTTTSTVDPSSPPFLCQM